MTGSSVLTFRVLPHWNIKPRTHDMVFHPITLYWHRVTAVLIPSSTFLMLKDKLFLSNWSMSQRTTKPTKWHVRWAKTWISLGICPVWSESLLCTQSVAKDPSFLHVDREHWSDWGDAQADLSLCWMRFIFVAPACSRVRYRRPFFPSVCQHLCRRLKFMSKLVF